MRCPHCGMPIYEYEDTSDIYEELIDLLENGDDPEEETE